MAQERTTPSGNNNGLWAAVVGSVIGCLPLVPLLGMAGIVVAYVAPVGVGRTRFVLGGLVGNPVLDGTLAALVAAILLMLAYGMMGFTSVQRANTRIYGQLRERLDQLEQRLVRLPSPQVRITPAAPQQDSRDATATIYAYDVENESATELLDVTVHLCAPGSTPTDASQLSPDWIIVDPPPAANTIGYAARSVSPGARQRLQISVPGGADRAVQLSVTASARDTIELSASATIEPDQAKQGAPLVIYGATSAAALREARAHGQYVAGELTPPSRGLRWVLATGYIDLWSRLHRADEALIELEPQPSVIRTALNDELRLIGSTIDNRDELLAELRSAVKALSPQAAATLLKLPPHDVGAATSAPAGEALAALRHVNGTINEIRDGGWDGLVRIRNHLAATILTAGLVSYGLLAFVLSQPSPVQGETIAVVAALYLVGAVIGLFNQLYVDSQADRAVEDYGLYLARLINIPLFSGLAAVFGVALTVLLPVATDPTAFPKAEIPSLAQAFDLVKHPLDPVFAAVFGLTPNLLISRLSDQANKLKGNISSTNAANHK